MPFNSFDDYPMNWQPTAKASASRTTWGWWTCWKSRSVRASSRRRSTAAAARAGRLPRPEPLHGGARLCARARAQGLAYGVTGKGTFVAPHAQSDLTITAEGADGLVELGMVTGFDQCDGLVADTMRTVAQRGYLSRLMDYSNPCGYPHHLEAGRRWLAWKGLRREPDLRGGDVGALRRTRSW